MEITILDKQILQQLYSSIEKQSLFQVVCSVRLVAQHNLAEKQQTINKIKEVIKIKEEEIVDSRKISQPRMVQIIRQMDELKKRYLSKFICCIALAGGMTQKEEQFVYYLVDLLQLPLLDE